MNVLDRATLRKLLSDLAAGRRSAAEVETQLAAEPHEALSFATLDHHRHLRCGFPEVIFGQGKTPAQVAEIFARLADRGTNVLATRVDADAAGRVLAAFPNAEYSSSARTIALRQTPTPQPTVGYIAVVCAGTADLPVAEEARITAELMDQRVETLYDVGVAGIHRLLARTAWLRQANVVVVVAGMEGALPSVVGGLVDVPVIAVPTSVGYGASLGGVAALLGMLNSCASGLSVVNIDNGFGAGYQAALVNRLVGRERRSDEATGRRSGNGQIGRPASRKPRKSENRMGRG